MTHGSQVEYTNPITDVVSTKVWHLNGVHVSISTDQDGSVDYAVHPFGKINFGQAVS